MGRAVFENVVGRAASRPSIQKFDRPGRAAAYLQKKCFPSSRDSMDRVGPWPMIYGLYTDRSALPMERPTCFQAPVRAVANKVWRTIATPTCHASTVSWRCRTSSAYVGTPTSRFHGIDIHRDSTFVQRRLACQHRCCLIDSNLLTNVEHIAILAFAQFLQTLQRSTCKGHRSAFVIAVWDTGV